MSLPDNPYDRSLGSRDPLPTLAASAERIRTLVGALSDEQLNTPWAPGKWTVAQIVTHLAHTELVFGVRARFALGQAGYVVQTFEQDDWMRSETGTDGRIAADALYGMRQLNLSLFRQIGDRARTTMMEHPERGTINVQWIIELLAGHDIHHLQQMEQVLAAPSKAKQGG